MALTIKRMMLFLLSHPETLKKTNEEIDTNVGNERIINESDLPKLPYLNNVLKETLRLTLADFPPRESSGDCTIQDYHVPKGTMLFVNALGINRDPELWDDAMSFKPERFDREEEEKVFKYMPFGAGRRKCPGEHLAMRMVMAGVGALVQCFEWEPMSKGEVDISSSLGLIVSNGKPVVAKYQSYTHNRPIIVPINSDLLQYDEHHTATIPLQQEAYDCNSVHKILRVNFTEKGTGQRLGTSTWHRGLWYMDREGMDSALTSLVEGAGV
ncbi:cytochrome P450 81Q32-like [Dioscorea cayenensis subsp. rotundata]|uniref:Cytochrome P450 81Q32-like n=1 Tax=Dioscorea cayennensis subsp. rotundata TaxID=55577 RepID=A0AB40AKX4_DIOCR|nr:cytochrome P450 81Q32-like [Dioscorea cayenensis subsp. rotundata]